MFCDFCHLTPEEERFLLFANPHWKVYLADAQDYWGRCIVVLRRHAARLSDLTPGEWTALKEAINRLEPALTRALGATMLNCSSLMNDAYKRQDPAPHVHIHVRPRYRHPVEIGGIRFVDEAFARHYDPKLAAAPSAVTEAIYALLRAYFDSKEA